VEDASIDEVAPTFKSLLRDGKLPTLPGWSNLSGLIGSSSANTDTDEISFVQASVEGIDVKNQQVVVSHSFSNNVETIDYDALVIATGAEISLDGVPGASELAQPFYTVEQCLELKRRLALLDSYLDERVRNQDETPVNVVVVGGGYSGVELALNLVDRLGNRDDNVHVTLVHRGKQVLQYATEHNRNAGIDALKSAGVNVMTSTSIVEVTPLDKDEHNRCLATLECLNNSTENSTISLETSLLLWTAGATPTSSQNEGIRNSILPRDIMGRIVTSPTLNVPEYPNIFAIGDCSRPKKEPYPGTAQVAIQMATVAAWNIYATLANNNSKGQEYLKLLPFTYLSLGEMMTLGRNDATISTLGGIELSGAGASWLRRLIYAVRMPTNRQRLSAAVDGTARKLARGALESSQRKSKPVDWK
jgi:NADH dehydrogenase